MTGVRPRPFGQEEFSIVSLLEMKMKKPPHARRLVRQDCLEPLGLTVTKGAEILGVTRRALNNLVNLKAGISPEMVIRLSKAFGSSPEGMARNADGV